MRQGDGERAHRVSRKRLLAAFLLGFVLCVPGSGATSNGERVTVYFFWGEGCPHCEREAKMLSELARRFDRLEIRSFEVWKDEKNAEFFRQVMGAAGAKTVGVPATIVGNRLFFGFGARTAREIRGAVAACVENGCPDARAVIGAMGIVPEQAMPDAVRLPFLGELDPASLSLPLFTVVLGALDSFNPCAFFVLLFLMSLVIHARSRPRMLLIGGIFVLCSGIVYFLFMAAWLNVFRVAGRMAQITAIAGVVAILVAGFNIKDFFFPGKGVSLSIPERAKPRLYERMRGLLRSPSLPALAGGTMVLAVTANTYELLCTAGFPMVYTRMLTLHALTPLQYYLYLGFYNFVYMVPLMLIVLAMTYTLGARKLSEWQGRKLKLVSGCMMLLLGAVLLVRPSILNSILAAMVLLVSSLAASAVVVAVAKRMRPEIVR